MFKIRSATRLALMIGVVCASIVWMAASLGVIPDPNKPKIQGRIALAKTVGTMVQARAESGHVAEMGRILNFIANSNNDLDSIGIRRGNHVYIASTGQHARSWEPLPEGKSTTSQIQAAIQSNGRSWGVLELKFKPLTKSGFAGLLQYPLPMITCLASLLALASWVLLGRTLKYMNPAKVVPTRVRSALDTLAEGLALVDPNGEIAHANSAFCKIVDQPFEKVIAQEVGQFGWTDSSDIGTLPWVQCLQDKEPVCGQILQLEMGRSKRKFMVNSTPIYSDQGQLKGVLNSFDDVTAMESKKNELSRMIQTLRRSRDEVERQNEKLNFLASYDPMTKCMNRRSFWVHYEELWANVPHDQLSIMMVDIDKFKSVNDTYGHSTGDEVIVGVGELLREVVGQKGIVCRYGGEEFTVVLPNMSTDEAEAMAEQSNQAFHHRKLANLDITASIGVSTGSFGAMDPQHLLDQADEALYAAKRTGRDRVIRFDKRPLDIAEEQAEENEEAAGGSGLCIPYSAVTGLLSALSFRSVEAAEHSIRVSDLCLAVGKELVKRQDLYALEVSALLHDIGKIGLPDEILNKTAPLTDADWQVIHQQNKVGVSIVQAACTSDSISGFISQHHDCLAARHGNSPVSKYYLEIPIEARIISVCDAFDELFRREPEGVSRQENVVVKMVDASPAQFDREVVQALVRHVRSHGYSTDSNHESQFSPREAHAIGQNIQLLCDAIAAEDLGQLRSIVDDIKDQSVSDSPRINAVVGRLETAIDEGDGEFARVLTLAEEVIALCRSTRRTFVGASEMSAAQD